MFHYSFLPVWYIGNFPHALAARGYSATVTPMLRQVPAIMDMAPDGRGVEVGHLGLGDLAQLILGDGGTLVLLGRRKLDSMPEAFLISTGAGGSW